MPRPKIQAVAVADPAAAVLAVVRRIPSGALASYGQVAAVAGLPGRARWVGRLLATVDAPDLPWHRVVTANGRLGLPPSHPAQLEQCRRLAAEGVVVRSGRVVDLTAHRWRSASDAPLLD